jgi:hypothetical protein
MTRACPALAFARIPWLWDECLHSAARHAEIQALPLLQPLRGADIKAGPCDAYAAMPRIDTGTATRPGRRDSIGFRKNVIHRTFHGLL